MKILFQCSCGDYERLIPIDTLRRNIHGSLNCEQCGKSYTAEEVVNKVNKLNVADFREESSERVS